MDQDWLILSGTDNGSGLRVGKRLLYFRLRFSLNNL